MSSHTLAAAPASVFSQATATATQAQTGTTTTLRIPDGLTFQHAVKLAITEDKPIMMDYWMGSLEKKVIIGVKEGGEKLLVKSEEEYTSPVAKIYKVGGEYIIATENSIYLVDAGIASKRISA